MDIKAISLWEPYASLVRAGSKTYETRSWATSYRGPLLICAAKGGLSTKALKELFTNDHFKLGLVPLCAFLQDIDQLANGLSRLLSPGKAVAVVDLVDCIPTEKLNLLDMLANFPFGDYSPNRFAWKLENIRAIESPFPVSGKQGFFQVSIPDNCSVISIGGE